MSFTVILTRQDKRQFRKRHPKPGSLTEESPFGESARDGSFLFGQRSCLVPSSVPEGMLSSLSNVTSKTTHWIQIGLKL